MSKKSPRWFPTPYTLVFGLIIFAVLLTHIMPAGSYDYTVPSTKEVIKSQDVPNYSGGEKIVPIAGTYKHINSTPQSLGSIFMAPIKGMADSVDIVTFVLIIGTFIAIFLKTGAFDAGISRVIDKLKGREILMIPILMTIFSLAGTIEGFQEETVGIYPMLVPVFVKLGYDPFVAVSVIIVGAVMGIFASIINPFSTGIATKFAGITLGDGIVLRSIIFVFVTTIAIIYVMRYARKIKKDITKSYAYDQLDAIKAKYSQGADRAQEFTLRHKLILLTVGGVFLFMIFSIIPFGEFGLPKLELGWWFNELSALFLGSSILIGVIGGLSEVELVQSIKDGLSEFMPVAFIIAISRAITLVLKDGALQDTILNSFVGILHGMPPILFLMVTYCLFVFLGLIIVSTSAMATITIPILAPLATMLGVPAYLLITAYTAGISTVFILNPADPILNIAISYTGKDYATWAKFIFPLVIIIMIFTFITLGIAAVI